MSGQSDRWGETVYTAIIVQLTIQLEPHSSIFYSLVVDSFCRACINCSVDRI